jgi:hypothetical protein
MDSHLNGTPCTATTKAGAPCRAYAVTTGPAAGKYCGIHAGFVHHAPTNARRCAALTTTGAQCQRWATHDSLARFGRPLCPSHNSTRAPAAGPHAPGAPRRCSALTRAGAPCRQWAARDSVARFGKPLCPTHAAANTPAANHPRRCTATTGTGARCRQWSQHDSLARFGRLLCPIHARAAAGHPHFHLPDPADEAAGRRCTATTQTGARCRRWALPGTTPPLCRQHRYPDDQPQIRHGLRRRTLALSPLEREALSIAWASGNQLDAELLLARLIAMRPLDYLVSSPRPLEKNLNSVRLLFRAITYIRRLVAARRELTAADPPFIIPESWAPFLPPQPEPDPLPPAVAALLDAATADSLIDEIGLTRVVLSWVLGLIPPDDSLTLAQLAPRVRLILRGTGLVGELLVEDFVKQPQRRARGLGGGPNRPPRRR